MTAPTPSTTSLLGGRRDFAISGAVLVVVGLWLWWLGGGFASSDAVALAVAVGIVIAVGIAQVAGIRSSLGVALGLATALITFFIWQGWSGADLNSTNLLTFFITGLAIGATYALYSTGLVVVYNTTGIFNFAQGAIGAFSAFLYWELRFNKDWPAPIALIVVIFIAAPIIGILLDQALMRWLEGSALVTQLMVTVGLMIGFLSLTGLIWDQNESRTLRPFFGTKSFAIGDVNVTYHRAISLVVAAVIAIALRFLFKSRLGVAMRAVVDNRSLAGLNGARPAVVSSAAWAIGTMLAAVAGILIAPGREMDPLNLNLIIVTAFAAAAIGQLRSLPLAFAGALFIGLAESFTNVFLSFGSDWTKASEGIAPIVLFIVVIALPQAKLEVGRVAAKNLRPVERLTKPWEAVFGAVVLLILVTIWSDGAFSFMGIEAWSQEGLSRGNQFMYTSIIALSLVPLTGWTGQVNFAPLAFAGFGATVFFHLSDGSGNGWWLLLVPFLCFPLGALVAIPVARLRGLYLALASMAFAVGMETLFFPHPDTLGGQRQFGALELFGHTFDRRGLMLFMVGVFGVMMTALAALRRSRYGRRWMAMNDSESASATLGVSTSETKVLVYGLSAAIAGIGGAFLVTARGSVDAAQEITLFGGLPIVLLMAVAGMKYPSAALLVGMNTALFIFIPQWTDDKNYGFLFDTLGDLGPGLLAITLVFKPYGAIYDIGKGFARFLPWRDDARAEHNAEKEALADNEIGEYGLERPFDPNEVVIIDRTLGVVDDLEPMHGYPQLKEPGGVTAHS